LKRSFLPLLRDACAFERGRCASLESSMTADSQDPSSATARPSSAPVGARPAHFLGRVRDVLFEQAQPRNGKPAESPAFASAPTRAQEPDLHAELEATLRDLIARDAGPALSEFDLQLEAVRDIVPERATRIRIALSVLSRKGVSGEQLQSDLARVALALTAQQRTFSEKVQNRRRELSALATQIDLECNELRSRAESEIDSLRAALAAQTEALARALSQRDERLRQAKADQEDLERKERAFGEAERRLGAEYEALSHDLARIFSEKV
jgi:hypothetical protein